MEGIAEGDLTLDEYVLYGIYAVHSEYSLPARYQSAAEETESLFTTYLQYWEQLGTSTQSELTDLMSTPLSGSLYQPTQNLGGPEPDFGNCDNTHNAFGQPVTFLFGMREIAGGGSLAPQGAAAKAKPFDALGEPIGALPVNRNDE